MEALTHLGQGLNFPIVLTNGSTTLTTYQDLLPNSIMTILNWYKGIKPFNPAFGSYLGNLIGEPNDAVLTALVKRFIYEALTLWEARISALDIDVISRGIDHIIVNIKYQIKATSELAELEYKFYV